TAGAAAKKNTCESGYGYGYGGSPCPGDNPTATLVKVWHSRAARLVNVLDRDGFVGVSCLAWSADGMHVAAGFRSVPQVVCWSADTKELLATRFEHEGPVYDLVFCADGKMLASFGQCGNRVRLWDGDTCESLRVVGPTSAFSRFAGGKLLLT